MPLFVHPRFCRLSLRTTPLWLALVLLAGCDADRGDYGRFDTAPAGPEVRVTRSWTSILEASPLPAAEAAPQAIAPLVSDILQLGAWPPQDPIQRAQLDSAWSGFVGFEGTRVGVAGIDSVLGRTGQLDAAEAQLAKVVTPHGVEATVLRDARCVLTTSRHLCHDESSQSSLHEGRHVHILIAAEA